jgi:hypothetical protein
MAMPGDLPEYPTLALDDDRDPVVLKPYSSEEPPRFCTLDGDYNVTPLPQPAPTRLRVPQPRRRASRGRPIRRRGSRRTTAPTRDGPEDGDPEPAGPGDPVGDTSRVLRPLRMGALA